VKDENIFFEILLIFSRNYDEDFEDDDNGTEESTNKKLAVSSAISPPQRLSSALNNKADDLQDELKRWKD
jgi:hypothetical protein